MLHCILFQPPIKGEKSAMVQSHSYGKEDGRAQQKLTHESSFYHTESNKTKTLVKSSIMVYVDIKSFVHMTIEIAIAIHASATYGDNRSPIRAHIQKNPRNPDLLRSMRPGITDRTYVLVQMRRRITSNSDGK